MWGARVLLVRAHGTAVGLPRNRVSLPWLHGRVRVDKYWTTGVHLRKRGLHDGTDHGHPLLTALSTVLLRRVLHVGHR